MLIKYLIIKNIKNKRKELNERSFLIYIGIGIGRTS